MKEKGWRRRNPAYFMDDSVVVVIGAVLAGLGRKTE
jgi:hypothetical protein